MRLFVAVSPPEEVLALVEALPRPNLAKLRWTTPAQWHVTLRFLGEVEDPGPVVEALRGVPAALHDAGVEVVEAELGPAVAWFTGRRILQVPVSGTEVLADPIITATSKWGDPPEHGPFVGHLTLARVRGSAKGPANLAGTPIRAAWRVDGFVLVSSTLGPGGAHYETLESVPLRPAPSPPPGSSAAPTPNP
ncbi:MAG TPA: RNA 2',3'-cyclic phosphodiesterase [Acidimicrobiales bacterium]|nr:RNA 2',3'-cyclic phosphodiesterase [Acidimicrobiales bacterium]